MSNTDYRTLNSGQGRASQSSNTPTGQREVLSVSQLNRRAKQLLETKLPLMWIEGEISNFSRPSSGHWYFTLKDAGAQIRCAMFRGRNQQVRTQPQQGSQVLIRAKVSLYEGRGDYQLIVEHMEDAGVGALQRAYEELKQRLHQEGLFEHHLKKTLPSPPKHLGVITSPTGAAIRDILHVLERRYPGLPVSIFPVAVQGNEAAPQIVQALDTANRLSDCDLLIVGRGGGSLEDLWPFNEETVARAIFSSRIPVISAVGHEVDLTIADYVADMRAPTPSAAAEICSPDGEDLLQQFCGFEVLLEQAMSRQLQQHGNTLKHLRARLQHPGDKLQNQAQQLDNLELKLRQLMQEKLSASRLRAQQLLMRQQSSNPRLRIQQLQTQVSQLGQRNQHAMKSQLQTKQQRLGQQAALLDSVSPLNTLKRGYSITSDAQGAVIQNVKASEVGTRIKTRVTDGIITSRVEATESLAE